MAHVGYDLALEQVVRTLPIKGDARVFGSEFGMRIWLRPDRMASLRLTAADVARAIRKAVRDYFASLHARRSG